MTLLREITGFRLVTADPDRLAAFYAAIGFSIGVAMPIPAAEMAILGLSGGATRTPLRLGDQHIGLDCFEKPGRPYPSTSAANDAVFQHFAIATDDVVAAWQLADAAGARRISTDGPVTLPASSGGVTAIKFADPDGHPLEFIQFVNGINTAWNGHGIMGIDHSAISVGDGDVSRRFYESMGLTCDRSTVNRGATQAALDGMADPIVDILPLLPEMRTPHLELLCYRRPAFRAFKWRPHDIAAARICWASDTDSLIADPDGHLHQFTREPDC